MWADPVALIESRGLERASAPRPCRVPERTKKASLAMNSLYTELLWLPRVPREFTSRLKALDGSRPPGERVAGVGVACSGPESANEAGQGHRQGARGGRSLNPLMPFRLAVLSNSTIDLIVPALVASAARHGIALEVIQPRTIRWRRRL